MPDREKIIKGLEKVWDAFNHMEHELYADYVFDALVLLKEQDECENCAVAIEDRQPVVRCKDCKHYMTIHCTCDGCCISDNWYCADGKRKEV